MSASALPSSDPVITAKNNYNHANIQEQQANHHVLCGYHHRTDDLHLRMVGLHAAGADCRRRRQRPLRHPLLCRGHPHSHRYPQPYLQRHLGGHRLQDAGVEVRRQHHLRHRHELGILHHVATGPPCGESLHEPRRHHAVRSLHVRYHRRSPLRLGYRPELYHGRQHRRYRHAAPTSSPASWATWSTAMSSWV